MTEDTPLPFDLPAVKSKKVSAADFAGGLNWPNGRLILLQEADSGSG